MTLAELQAHVGCPRVRGVYYLEHRAGLDVTAWGDVLGGRAGWWVAITIPCGEHELVAAITWVAGGIRSRDDEINYQLPRVAARHGRVEEGHVS